MAYACGLDFGTSNSTVGVYQDEQIVLAQLEDDKVTLPSVVFFNADLDEVSYGRAALTDYLDGYEGRLMRSMKSLLGTGLIEGHTEVQGRRISYKSLLAQYIQELKRRSEINVKQSFKHAVFGRPVHFIDDDLKADQLAEATLKEIAISAGFQEVSFQFEPIAAALDYESRLNREELVLIVDIGGGTSDFSIVRLSPERKRSTDRQQDILSNSGVHIGGTDFDKYLSLQKFMPLLGLGGKLLGGADMPSANYFNLATWHTINLVYAQKVVREIQDLQHDIADPALREACARFLYLIEERNGHWLAIQAEDAKIRLSSEAVVEPHLDRLRTKDKLAVVPQLQIAEQDFRAAVSPLLDEICNTVEHSLRQAMVGVDAIDTIYFTGGASGVKGLRQKLATLLPSAKQVDGDIFGSIGSGLGWEAHRRYA
ncbi:Hsp70 family protein [Undibacterium sp. LX40W]|uniref:Hsp70 family protein n=1 Tax=Undibacterium nitidum TaxID=2762298 RepID=A0A923KLZ6_9BURK|nr:MULTISPECIES: Hsp70 family protein [Undibacterium]MBC3882375.1 Hsp70 family protein [Undibacterium nitidum]MBC3892656.1 Hsp70 family protein [Undibacterium sp. LX40W]